MSRGISQSKILLTFLLLLVAGLATAIVSAEQRVHRIMPVGDANWCFSPVPGIPFTIIVVADLPCGNRCCAKQTIF